MKGYDVTVTVTVRANSQADAVDKVSDFLDSADIGGDMSFILQYAAHDTAQEVPEEELDKDLWLRLSGAVS